MLAPIVGLYHIKPLMVQLGLNSKLHNDNLEKLAYCSSQNYYPINSQGICCSGVINYPGIINSMNQCWGKVNFQAMQRTKFHSNDPLILAHNPLQNGITPN